ncbi:hypothetical protein C8R43DRAFT_942654 [Mycena crocata]|nr:hypothetical protein C8R43DRAFT_942654 [Mycena crocata]
MPPMLGDLHCGSTLLPVHAHPQLGPTALKYVSGHSTQCVTISGVITGLQGQGFSSRGKCDYTDLRRDSDCSTGRVTYDHQALESMTGRGQRTWRKSSRGASPRNNQNDARRIADPATVVHIDNVGGYLGSRVGNESSWATGTGPTSDPKVQYTEAEQIEISVQDNTVKLNGFGCGEVKPGSHDSTAVSAWDGMLTFFANESQKVKGFKEADVWGLEEGEPLVFKKRDVDSLAESKKSSQIQGFADPHPFKMDTHFFYFDVAI